MSQQPTNSSLLSLSIAAANAQPIHIQGHNNRHHRRLSSTSKARRRLSDARDAANRPTYSFILILPGYHGAELLTRSATAAALSLSSLSLSSSPPSSHGRSASLGSASIALVNDAMSPPGHGNGQQTLKLEPAEYAGSSNPKSPNAAKPIPIVNGKSRKRGMNHKSQGQRLVQIYRHPSCLIKHRWEHTPHWCEASKYVLSKHQQVQLLEAAAILSHLSPSSSSLPEDRSLWPSFLSGGLLPPPENTTLTSYVPHVSASYNPSYSPISSVQNQLPPNARLTPSSVPASGTSCPHSHYLTNGAGPRLHDYAVPGLNNGVTQLGPGLVGIPNDGPSIHDPIVTAKSVPMGESVPPLIEEEDSKRDKYAPSLDHPYPRPRSHSGSVAISHTSGSRSRSTSTSEEDDDEMSSYVDGEKRWQGFTGRYSSGEDVEEDKKWHGYGREKKEEGWDGMEMEMEMD
ncbi:hypothetical protein AX15_003622 [Amanita polypyramis BW_CC]|nr:hypothetical protein AX15_003622 [Amanita polypyramis BW_CC]